MTESRHTTIHSRASTARAPGSLTWDQLDWTALNRLRDIFLAGEPGPGSYWRTRDDLANYDFTYAQRIGWKWNSVLEELKLRGWTPPPGRPLLDWGCGSGTAARRVLDCFGTETFARLDVFDRSSLAMEFSADAARQAFPGLQVELVHAAGCERSNAPERTEKAGRTDDTSGGVVLISHVLNELDEVGLRNLRQVLERADAVLWIEPGTYRDSRSLIAMRESLREQFIAVAPCTHQAMCGLCVQENERHWCHHFAAPPPGIMADSNWVRFAQRAGIDLRSLPYSFVVLERKGLRDSVPGLLSHGWSRVLGEPRVYKGFAKVLSCQAEGVREREVQKRDAPAVFKAFKTGRGERLYRWMLKGDRIVGTERPAGNSRV